jgi:hypothetical protein
MIMSSFQLSSLREIDIELMKRLSPRINVIPVVGKADTFTPTELADFKKRVRCKLSLIGPTQDTVDSVTAILSATYFVK